MLILFPSKKSLPILAQFIKYVSLKQKPVFVMKSKISFLSVFIFILIGFNMDAREYDISDYLNPDNPNRKAYIERYKDIAMDEMRRAGIPASIKLAQGILESGDGKSSLASEANNHFGMKCGSKWNGDTFYLHDDDFNSDGELIKSCFRVFDNPDESYYAHSEFLLNPRKVGRYGFLFNLDIRDYRAWAKGLKKSGYATNPRYAQLLIGIIETNRLYEYDKISLMNLGLVEVSPTPTKPIATPGTPVDVSNVAKNEVVLNNSIRMIFAQGGDTPKSIEDFFGVKAKKVTIYNELYEGGSIKFKDGDRIYLQSKRKKWRGKADYHQVRSGETMYSIAQQYGLKIKSLRNKNRMVENTEPAIGQHIALKRKIKKSRIIKLRDTSKDPVSSNNDKDDEPNYDLSDGKNIVDIIRSNVSAFDMKERTEAYVKITDGIINAPEPDVIIVQPTRPNPTTTQPTIPDVIINPYPTVPPVVIQPTTPTPTPISNYHTVESGDTLYSISRKYNADVANIKRWNNLPSNIISIGQRLRVK
jgi:LysM repeat protein